ncbi:fibronectin type III domain-containing protein [Bifidobacterium saguinibicoloris]|uniref:fibronectin type III domain-containing protein n=1 Tax=Bifidobacterium saguinibicoloris TaxID=2834433 RepID=UPI001C588CF9|nr:fibronectin type III domain-containing protein [Bifidobacterium saguinibicoloris]MBW3080296.1 fibronectin type III domain-containing protein [Bifidobacterium saguinibicoloris]
MRTTNGGGAPARWRAAAGALVACATLLCGLTAVDTAQAAETGAKAVTAVDTGLGNDIRIELAKKDGDAYVGSGEYVTDPGTANTPVTFTDASDDSTLWSIVGWGDQNGARTVTVKGRKSNARLKGGHVRNNTDWTSIAAENNGKVCVKDGGGYGGWESIKLVPAGDGTVAFRDTDTNELLKSDGTNLVVTDSTDAVDAAAGHFIVHTSATPAAPTGVTVSNVTNATADVSFTAARDSFVTDYEIDATPTDAGKATVTLKTTATQATLRNLAAGTSYNITVRSLNGADAASSATDAVALTTAKGVRLAAPTNVKAAEADGGKAITLTWDKVDGAKGYKVLRAKSAYAADKDFVSVTGDKPVTGTTYTDGKLDEGGKYANYYKVVTVNEDGDVSDLPETTASLDRELFGDHTLVFAPTDDMGKVDKVLADLFTKQNDIAANAQFRSEHWQVYFKPGSYVQDGNVISNINVGFYTSLNGLGKVPTDTMLNNVSTSSYLAANAGASAQQGNATCNFWRSIENLGVKNTGTENGKSGNATFAPGDSRPAELNQSWRPDYMNWGVAQAAPMRRVWTDRTVAYDWNYGWASGGYTADSKLEGDDGGNTAGTASGQQFYTRNSELKGAAYGTTLNNFLQGVTASNVPGSDGKTGTELVGTKGTSNWGVAGDGNNQQVTTAIDSTEKIAEKPFLYLDDNGEYQVFVPGYRENAKGVSWGKGKANDGMGKGTSIPLSEFYIAKPTDTAAEINKQIAAGRNIYLTPGIYHAETPIDIDRSGVVVLGTGMATIIPDNEDTAIRISDKAQKGIRLAGLILDAGKHSKYLLQVGTTKTAGDASDPIELQDIFFRIGGTTDETTSADTGIEINTGNTIADHFWIWRADHGAGVGWGKQWNYSRNGLIVNGDDVTAYALFNEHHEEYDTLWNGENGKTFFYQNEKCYDPVSQDQWMSHNGTVKGYAAYKVANGVKKHYAVGLGIYNVFIYTGPETANGNQDGGDPTDPDQHTGAGTTAMEMDNAVEVPNAKGVIIENVTTQSFADLKNKDDNAKAVRTFNTIINGVGAPVGSGPNITSWSRKFLLRYQGNGTADSAGRTVDGKSGDATLGTAVYGKNPGLTDTDDSGKDNKSNFGKFIGADTSETVRQLGEEVDLSKLGDLKTAIDAAEAKTKADGYAMTYTEASRKAFEQALAEANTVYGNLTDTDYLKYDAKSSDAKAVEKAIKALSGTLEKVTTEPSEPGNPSEPNQPAGPNQPTGPSEKPSDDAEKKPAAKADGAVKPVRTMANTGAALAVPAVVMLLCVVIAAVTLKARRDRR